MQNKTWTSLGNGNYASVWKVSHNPETLTTIYMMDGKHDGHAYSGTVTFHDGGDFETALSRDVVTKVFTELDERGILSGL